MAQVDTRERQLIIKLVYYGPPLSGKTTNLRYIHTQVDEDGRGRLMTLDTRDDRTLFFDLLPIFFKASGLSLRLKVYTVPGQPMHEATRRIVLQGTDGIVFVADAQRSAIRGNNESYDSLVANMSELGIKRERVPVVVQFNKCDLRDALAPDETSAWARRHGETAFRSSALRGEGVLDTFFGLLTATWGQLDRQLNLQRTMGIGGAEFMGALRRHMNVAEGASALRGQDDP